MPPVDHHQRRRDIAEAVWRLLESGGLEAASVRGVIAETGLSSGSIRFFFSTQAELHRFAMSALADRVRERITSAAAEPDPERRVLAMVSELVPLRDDTRRELGVWLAFVARSRHDPQLAHVVAEQASTVREFLGAVLADLVTLGLRPTDTDIASETTRLNAVVDGLTFELLTTPDLISPDQATAALRESLVPERVGPRTACGDGVSAP